MTITIIYITLYNSKFSNHKKKKEARLKENQHMKSNY